MAEPNPGNLEPNPATVAPPIPEEWLGKKLLDENAIAYRTVWTIYISFYTVILSVNILAMGLVVQYIPKQYRGPTAWTLLVCNLVGVFTSWTIARFSSESAKRYEDLCKVYIQSKSEPQHNKLKDLASSPMPGWLGKRAGILCAIVLFFQAVGWYFIKEVGNESAARNSSANIERPLTTEVRNGASPSASPPTPSPKSAASSAAPAR